MKAKRTNTEFSMENGPLFIIIVESRSSYPICLNKWSTYKADLGDSWVGISFTIPIGATLKTILTGVKIGKTRPLFDN